MNTINKLCFSLLLCVLGAITASAQDWPQWRGPNRDGVTDFKAPQTWPQQLTQTWKVPAGLGDATPALVNNKLYVFGKIGENEVLQCLDASSGKQIWQSAGYPAAPTQGPSASHPGPRSSVSVSNGKVVTIGVWGDVTCYDASTGKQLWKNEEYKGKVPPFQTGMSPLIDGPTCYTHLGGPQTGTFVAFNLADGTVSWKVEGEGPAYGSPVLMTVSGTKQIVFQSLTKLVSFNPADGKQLWEYATPYGQGRVSNAISPVADQNNLYFGGVNNGFACIEIKKESNNYSVNKLWSNTEVNSDFSTPLLKDGFLYGLNSQGKLFCLNVANGQIAWTDNTAFQRFGSLVDTGKEIVVLSSNSNFAVLNPNGQKYDQVAFIKLEGKDYYAHPILSGSMIILKDSESLTMYTSR